jgi:C4-dicarboxylate-specific signal transduction histidine kinase
VRDDTEYRWVASKGRMVKDERGARRMIGVYVDTTDRKKEEMQTRAQKEQLTHLSRVATLGELSGAIAHEMNQPLSAILINAQAARRQVNGANPDLAEVDACLADIVAEDKRASAVIERLRALFRRGVVQRQRLDLNDCIREVLALEHSDLIMRNVVTHVDLASEPCMIEGDRIQLQQAVLNLIVNACDAMAGAAVSERQLRVASSMDDGAIRLTIGDTGPGVSDPEAIFTPLYSTKHEGVGLGLAICRTIVASHNGRLWASNNENGGAVFSIELPSAAADLADSDGPKSQDARAR